MYIGAVEKKQSWACIGTDPISGIEAKTYSKN